MILSLGRLAIVSLWMQSCIRKRVKMSKYNKKEVELNMLQDMHYDALILYRVEQWLKNEVESNQDVADAKNNKEDTITSDGTDDIICGRHECANSLSEQISTWRKELRGLE